ncbi:MAG: SCP2 sterol-binding domain-containing protein [Desulfobacterales bacterium]|nr:SCP2 sterol-binding domain-containing protein [Desulfobacterales bacterium]MBF0396860.1 SCP2 sterol-binding domain-containing protein [Desulfobacterales bacterium]
MEESITYLSYEWRDAAEKKLREELTPEQMKFISTSMSSIYKNCADGKERYLYIKCEEGDLSEISVGEGESPQAEFKIIGNYDTFALITQAKLSSQKALMTGKLKLKGNMVKALKLASIADRLNRVLAKIPAKY